MAVVIQYVVTHKGVEKLVTTDKKEADQYDKMLDVADGLAEYIEAKGITLDDELTESLTVMLAKNRVAVGKLLKGASASTILEEESADVVSLNAKKQ